MGTGCCDGILCGQGRSWYRVQADVEYDFVYVDQESFEQYNPTSFRQLVEGFREYKEEI